MPLPSQNPVNLRTHLQGLTGAIANCDPNDRLATGEIHKQLGRLRTQLERDGIVDQLGPVSLAVQLADHLTVDGKVTTTNALALIETIVLQACKRLGVERSTTAPVAPAAPVVEDPKAAKKSGGLQMLSARRLGEIMVQLAMLEASQVERALAYQHAKGCRLGEALIEMGLVSKETVANALKVQRMRTGNNKDGPWRIGA